MTQGIQRILIVDDEPSLLKMMGAYLSRLGYSVTTADTTETAWAVVEKAPEELAAAVLDASMAGMAMHDLAARMLNANAAMHVLVASGYPIDTTSLEAMAPGRVAFLQKPFTPTLLTRKVQDLFEEDKKGMGRN